VLNLELNKAEGDCIIWDRENVRTKDGWKRGKMNRKGK
jgi:hypothetical protein